MDTSDTTHTIRTKDGILITDVPDDVPDDSPELKRRVAVIRSSRKGNEPVTTSYTNPTPWTASADPMAEVVPGAPAPGKTDVAGVLSAVDRALLPATFGAAVGSPLGPEAALAGAGVSTLVFGAGDLLVPIVNKIFGTTYSSPTDALNHYLTKAGFAIPDSEFERIVQAASMGAAGAIGGAGVGQILKAGAPALGALTPAQGVGASLASQAGRQVVGGVASGAASQGAKELGAPLPVQIGAGVAGGAVAAGLAAPRAAAPQQMEGLVSDAERAGIRAMTTDVIPPKTFVGRWLQAAGEKVPIVGTGGPRAAQQVQRVDAVRNTLRDFGADDVSSLSDDVMRDLSTRRARELNRWTTMKSEVISRLSKKKEGVVYASYDDRANDMADVATHTEELIPKNRLDDFNNWLNDLSDSEMKRISDLDSGAATKSEFFKYQSALKSGKVNYDKDGQLNGIQGGGVRYRTGSPMGGTAPGESIGIPNGTTGGGAGLGNIDEILDALSNGKYLAVRSEIEGLTDKSLKEKLLNLSNLYDDYYSKKSMLPRERTALEQQIGTAYGNIQSHVKRSRGIGQAADTGAVPVPKTIAAIDEQINRLQALKTKEVQPVIARLQDWKAAVQDQDLSNVETLRKQLGESFKAPELASVRTTGEKSLSSIYGALREDMGAFIKTNGAPKDYAKWQIANRELSTMMGEISDTALGSVLKRGDATPEVIDKLLFSKRPSEINLLYRNLTPEGRANARAAILAKAAERATSAGEKVNPNKFANEVRALGNSVGVFFSGDDAKTVEGLVRVLDATKRASQAAVMPPTGIQTLYTTGLLGLGTVFGGGLKGFIGTAAAAGGIGGLARLYETPAVRSILIQLPRVKPNSGEEAALLKRLIATMYSQKEDVGKNVAQAVPVR